MTTYIHPAGYADGEGSIILAPIGIPISRSVGIINDYTKKPIDGLATGTSKIYTTTAQTDIVGVALWLVGVAGSGTVASFSMGTGSGTTDLFPITAMTGVATANEKYNGFGWGVLKVLPAGTDINIAITTAATGFTQYDLVPLLYGTHLDRNNP